uniref:NS1 protein n=1 Tax=Coleura bat parvovirus TaxID=3141917 RepID=A0AAU7DZY8_9VIRU
MNNDLYLWANPGASLGSAPGRVGQSSWVLDQDVAGNASGTNVQDETSAIDQPLEQELQSMVDRFVSRLEKENWEDSGYYVSDVYACESVSRAAGLAKKLAERARDFRRGFIGIALHGNHVHSIHSCAYSNKCCRCSFKDFPEAKEDIRRLLRKPPPIETFKRSDWENITKYFCTKGRRATFFKINGVVQGLPIEITNLSDIILSGKVEGRPYASLEDCNDPLDNNSERKRGIAPKGDGSSGARKRRGVSNTGGPGGIRGVPGVILSIIERYAVCPLSEIVYTREYLENQIALKRLDDRDVKNAIDCHAGIINTWSREDFVKFYTNPNTVKIWSARSIDLVDLYYLSYEESQAVILKLLQYQCGDNYVTFVKDLINVVDMRIPKCNCFLIVSPPSAGKNFLVDAVKDYFLNVGQMQNPNKYNTFAYQDCHNRRLLIWNEPNYEPRETENLKMLFGGDNLSANVKCKPQANVKRTPVICMSNVMPRFADHDAFVDRVIKYYWNSAPFLKDVSKKPRPDAVMDLLYSINGE